MFFSIYLIFISLTYSFVSILHEDSQTRVYSWSVDVPTLVLYLHHYIWKAFSCSDALHCSSVCVLCSSCCTFNVLSLFCESRFFCRHSLFAIGYSYVRNISLISVCIFDSSIFLLSFSHCFILITVFLHHACPSLNWYLYSSDCGRDSLFRSIFNKGL